MSDKKNILFDLTNVGTWGDKSLSFGLMQWYKLQGNSIYVKTSFSNHGAVSGEVKEYDPLNFKDKSYSYLYHPLKEPVDFFVNLIVPTFECEYYDVRTNYRTCDFDECAFDEIVEDGPRAYSKFVQSKNAQQFDYVLGDEKKDKVYNSIKEELSKTKNIILYANWDEEMLFETDQRHCKGRDISHDMFMNIFSSVELFDEYCVKNSSCRIILFNKKAVDWSNILKSKFYDMRYFEEKGLNFSQAFELCVNNCVATIGAWSSPQTWFNFAKDKNHIVYFKAQPWRVVRNLEYYAWNKAISREEVKEIFHEPQ